MELQNLTTEREQIDIYPWISNLTFSTHTHTSYVVGLQRCLADRFQDRVVQLSVQLRCINAAVNDETEREKTQKIVRNHIKRKAEKKNIFRVTSFFLYLK